MGFVTKVIGRPVKKALDEFVETPQAQTAIAQAKRQMAVVKIARAAAGSPAEDELACTDLRERLPEDAEAVSGATKHLAALRTSYLDDRAYRLLTAVVEAMPVRAIDPVVRDQFLAEAKLGRMPLEDAFEYLASLEPRLRNLPPASRAANKEQLWSPRAGAGWATRRESPADREHRPRRRHRAGISRLQPDRASRANRSNPLLRAQAIQPRRRHVSLRSRRPSGASAKLASVAATALPPRRRRGHLSDMSAFAIWKPKAATDHRPRLRPFAAVNSPRFRFPG